MKLRPLFAFGWFAAALTLLVSPAHAADRRFSATLDPAEAAHIGLVRLSSDQVAVLDALVRHDTAKVANASAAHPVAPRFSQRLSADERRNAGLTLLGETELARLDADVEGFSRPATSGAVSATLTAPAATIASPTAVQWKREPEIHGSVSFMVGGGSHGYSEYGGAMDVTYFDPAHGFEISAGYAELHSSGGTCFRRF
jgi:hypothetical protein